MKDRQDKLKEYRSQINKELGEMIADCIEEIVKTTIQEKTMKVRK